MCRLMVCLFSCVVMLGLAVGTGAAATPYYQGKTVIILVGSSPGGGFDSYSRGLARHLGKHIPGNPTVIVENQGAAGGLMAANQLARMVKPNGLTIGTFNGTLLFDQLLGREGTEFDSRKFEYVGAMAKVAPVFIFSKASGITNMDKWLASKTPAKLGGLGPGNLAPDNTPKILKATLGLPIQLVTGYKGTADVRLAVDGKEVAGGCLGWESAKMTWRKDLDSGDAIVVLQAVPKPLHDLPKVPLAISYAKTEEARKLINAGIHGCGLFARPYAMTPGTPKDRVQLIRTAFEDTLKDKEFLAEMSKAKLDLDPATGPDLEQAVLDISRLDPATMSKLKDILFK